jgi:putative transposase
LGWAPDERTLQRNFHRLGLTTAAAAGSASVFGRFEAAAPNDLWVGDALHGIRIQARKTYLFAFLDDHSRLLPGYRWGHAEDTVRLAAALRPALASRG